MNKWMVLAPAGIILLALIILTFLVLRSAQRGATFLLYNPVSERKAFLANSPDHDETALLEQYNLASFDSESVTLTTEDGLQLTSRYFPSQNGAVVIFVHGFKGNYATMIPYAAPLIAEGYGALLFDLRAHGGSDGELLSHGHAEMADLESAYEYVVARPGVNPNQIGMVGNSMGGVLAILYTAQNPAIQAVASDSPYAQFDAQAIEGFLGLSVPRTNMVLWFVERDLDVDMASIAAVDHIGQISPRPVLLMAGEQDRIVPVESAERLYDAAGEPKTLWLEPSLGHIEFATEQSDAYSERIIAFFDSQLLKK